MSKDKRIEMANRALDGDLDQQESSDYEEALKKDPALREIQRELQSADKLLREAQPVEPPPALRQNVLRAVKAQQVARVSQPGWFQRLISSGGRRIEIQPSMGIAMGFAMGVLLVAAISTMTSIPWSAVGNSESVGTIGNHQIVDKKAVSDKIDISVDGKLAGHVEYVWSDGALSLDVGVESTDAVTISLEFNPAGLEINSIERLSQSVTDLTYGDGLISIAHVGSGNYKLVFERLSDDPSDMKLSVGQAGAILNETMIGLNK